MTSNFEKSATLASTPQSKKADNHTIPRYFFNSTLLKMQAWAVVKPSEGRLTSRRVEEVGLKPIYRNFLIWLS